jgi:regulatory protein
VSGRRWTRSRPLESEPREEESNLLEDHANAPQVQDRDGFEHALALAYRYLSRRERTVAETRAHLAGKGVEANTTEDVIATLIGQGYLNDARFARLFAQDKRALEQWGSDRIKLTLIARGVDRELIDRALPADGELDHAVAVLRRRFAVPPRDRRERDRALGVLLRKGYEQDVALEALSTYIRGAP